MDFCSLTDLTLMAGFDEPLDIGFECRPPEAVKEDTAHGVEALVAEFVVSIVYKGVSNRGAGIKLMPATVLLLPKLPSCNEEAVHSANKMSQHISREV